MSSTTTFVSVRPATLESRLAFDCACRNGRVHVGRLLQPAGRPPQKQLLGPTLHVVPHLHVAPRTELTLSLARLPTQRCISLHLLRKHVHSAGPLTLSLRTVARGSNWGLRASSFCTTRAPVRPAPPVTITCG